MIINYIWGVQTDSPGRKLTVAPPVAPTVAPTVAPPVAPPVGDTVLLCSNRRWWKLHRSLLV